MTAEEALKQLRELIKKHKVELHWTEPPISLEEIIVAREGNELLEQIYGVIK